MNPNVESRFALLPQLENMSRSKMKRTCSIKTSWNTGQVIPFFVDEVLPGSTLSIDTSKVVRMQSLITPLLDSITMDTMYFYIPNRLIWRHWQQFCGESDKAWLPTVEYTEPTIKAPEGGWDFGTIADYMGVRPKVNDEVSALPFRAYAKVIDDWFRSTVVQDPLNIPDGDETQTGSNGDNYINDIALGGKPFIANKFHDFFTSATPSVARGPDVTIDIGQSGPVSVTGNGKALGITNGTVLSGLRGSGSDLFSGVAFGSDISSTIPAVQSNPGVLGVATLSQLGDHPENSGLVANISGTGVVTISELRTAFQIQKFYEKQTNANRYIEVLKVHFGVTSPDARLQRSEFLGASRQNININAVTQTSASGTTPQGNQAAYSLTTEYNSDFTKSFVEHGWIIGVVVCRYKHTYTQGSQKFWYRRTLFDRYWPVLANLSNQPIKNRELYVQGTDVINPDTGKPYDEEVFGYQEAWAEYRYLNDRCTASMRPDHPQSLDSWHLGDDYSSLPHLSYEWLKEDKSNVDRTLAVTSAVSDQFYGDFFVNETAVLPMPLYSVPGLIDHH